MEFNETWQEWRSQGPLPSLCGFFFGRLENQDGRQASNWRSYSRLLLWNRWREFNETWPEARSQCPQWRLSLSSRSENKDGSPASDWLRYLYPRNEVRGGGVYWNRHVRSSVRPSVRPAAFGFPAHNCFPFTPIIMKLHMQTPHEARMCPIDFEVKRSKVKVTMEIWISWKIVPAGGICPVSTAPI